MTDVVSPLSLVNDPPLRRKLSSGRPGRRELNDYAIFDTLLVRALLQFKWDTYAGVVFRWQARVVARASCLFVRPRARLARDTHAPLAAGRGRQSKRVGENGFHAGGAPSFLARHHRSLRGAVVFRRQFAGFLVLAAFVCVASAGLPRLAECGGSKPWSIYNACEHSDTPAERAARVATLLSLACAFFGSIVALTLEIRQVGPRARGRNDAVPSHE